MANLLPRIGFIDETSLKTNMAKTTGWSPKGARLIDHAPFGHWNTQTFIAALRHDRLDAPWVIDGAMNRELFELYVETQLAPTLQAGDVIILDNLSSHKSPTAADAMRAVGAWFLFRCSGENAPLGAVEKAWSGDSALRPQGARFNYGADYEKGRGGQLLEVHRNRREQGLDLHVFETSACGPVQSMERFGGSVRALDAPSVAVVAVAASSPHRRLFRRARRMAGKSVGDVHPSRRCSPGNAAVLQRACGAVASLGAVPAPVFRGCARRECLARGAADTILLRIILEALDGKAPPIRSGPW